MLGGFSLLLIATSHRRYAAIRLVTNMNYPTELLSFSFDESFAIRGLHFDTREGLLMKIDQNCHIQVGVLVCVFVCVLVCARAHKWVSRWRLSCDMRRRVACTAHGSAGIGGQSLILVTPFPSFRCT